MGKPSRIEAVTESKEPQMRVVDRRWWARSESDDPVEESRERKPTVVEELEQRLAKAAEQLQSVLIEHRRAAEEFEQVKVRLRRDAAREVERGRRAVLVDMLEVIDNLDRAISAARETGRTDPAETLLRGVELVREQFLAKLEAFGVNRVPALGVAFDPERHEAVSLAPVADPSQAGVVIAVLKEGYAIGDELLRPASVVVGTHG
jgi:molecular chaperone GrpE